MEWYRLLVAGERAQAYPFYQLDWLIMCPSARMRVQFCGPVMLNLNIVSI